jgi:tRNA threonylcarbamoyladenosine biosynthesis protein TsaB
MTDADRWLLGIDTATSVVVVAAARPDGTLLETRTFAAGHRHGSHLLPTIQALVVETRLSMAGLAGVVVGVGPGAFTGLRVGLATAKTLAHGLGCPIVGVSTGEALLAAAREAAPGWAGGAAARDAAADGSDVLFLPAGLHDRVIVESGQAPRLEAGDPAGEPRGAVAVDLDGRASQAAVLRGKAAIEGLPAALVRLGADRLAAGDVDDVERLVPEYVSLPRGVTSEVGDGGVAWSRDPR